VLRTQLETAAPQSIEEDFVSTDSNTGPRTEVCFSHKDGVGPPNEGGVPIGGKVPIGMCPLRGGCVIPPW
jgi:hypothetical protein